MASGWKLRTDGLGDVEIVGDVTNKADDARSMFLSFTLLKGTKLLASIDCSSDEIEKGQSVALKCLSTDKLPKAYDKVTVEDTI